MSLARLMNYPFVTNALVVGVLVALCAALLGVILVLKKYSLIGHGLADVGFASLSLALALNLPPILVSAPVVILASVAIMAVSQRKGVAGDVAIGIAATSALAIGIVITAVTRGFNIDVYDYMFGSILSVEGSDILLSLALAAVVIGLFALTYNRLFLITCDEDFACACGINVTMYQFLISLLTAFVVVIGMRLMGTLLISSLIIFPAVTARRLVKSFKALVLLASAVSVVCFVVGLFLSFALNLPTGAAIVAANLAAMLLSFGAARVKG